MIYHFQVLHFQSTQSGDKPAVKDASRPITVVICPLCDGAQGQKSYTVFETKWHL